MAFDRAGLQRVGGGLGPQAGGAVWAYTSNDNVGTAAGQIGTAGYFNDARVELSKGDHIQVAGLIDGTPVRELYVVTAAPATGNVTVV